MPQTTANTPSQRIDLLARHSVESLPMAQRIADYYVEQGNPTREEIEQSGLFEGATEADFAQAKKIASAMVNREVDKHVLDVQEAAKHIAAHVNDSLVIDILRREGWPLADIADNWKTIMSLAGDRIELTHLHRHHLEAVQ